ncbi:hypothetical protein [Desulfopila sp. IMCC35008]|nr:hypothetical protein [Desulfopila sp. IMCC35008]
MNFAVGLPLRGGVLTPSTTVQDQNGDGKIGLAEAVYYLKSAAAY